MTFLVDANVLSEPTKPAPNGKVVEWLSTNERTAEAIRDAVAAGAIESDGDA